MNPNHNGTIPMSDLIKRAEEIEFRNVVHEKKMLDIRNFLKHHVEKHRHSASNNMIGNFVKINCYYLLIILL